jgi:pseudouridine-5'-phosphate glycosidase
VDDAVAAAALIETQFALGLGGVLVANPIPAGDALDAAMIARTIEAAVADADRLGIGGKALTPYLLKRIVELTGGKSLVSNIALVENNVRVATAIALALAARSRG